MNDAFGNKLQVGDRIIKGKESGHRIYYKRGAVIEMGTERHSWGETHWLKAKWEGENSASKRAGKCRPDYCIKLPIE